MRACRHRTTQLTATSEFLSTRRPDFDVEAFEEVVKKLRLARACVAIADGHGVQKLGRIRNDVLRTEGVVAALKDQSKQGRPRVMPMQRDNCAGGEERRVVREASVSHGQRQLPGLLPHAPVQPHRPVRAFPIAQHHH